MFRPLGHLQRLNRCYRICCCILHMSNVSLQGCRRVRTKIYIYVISKNIFKVRLLTRSFSVVSIVLIRDHPLCNCGISKRNLGTC
jgi:hypothetical protein